MAKRSLSPKRIAERLHQHYRAVMVLAHRAAKKSVQSQLRAQGLKLSEFSCKDIAIQAEAYFDAHRARLIEEAREIVNTSPYFAQYRVVANIESHAQTAKAQSTGTFPPETAARIC
jgi:cysteine synthase